MRVCVCVCQCVLSLCALLCEHVYVCVRVCELKYSALFVHKLDIALSLDAIRARCDVVVVSIYTHAHIQM